MDLAPFLSFFTPQVGLKRNRIGGCSGGSISSPTRMKIPHQIATITGKQKERRGRYWRGFAGSHRIGTDLQEAQ
jgi:hypothetical protein